MATHALPRPQFTHLADVQPRPRLVRKWERLRHRQAHWLMECAAEFMGVFLYVYGGVGSTAPWVLGTLTGQSFSSLFQVGLAYALGIVFALVICGPTSGGHFNPGVTLCFVLYRKFPRLKALRYVIAQLLGSYVACLVIYCQWNQTIMKVQSQLAAQGTLDSVNFTPNGPAGIFGVYAPPGSKLGLVFVNEFVCDFVISLAIWACTDPTNFMVSPVMAPWIVALVFTMVIWGFAPIGLACNTARDVGSRLMVLTIWGTKANGGTYAAITACTNWIAYPCGALFYEVFLMDSSRVVTLAHAESMAGHQAHCEHMEVGVSETSPQPAPGTPSSYDNDKPHVMTIEEV